MTGRRRLAIGAGLVAALIATMLAAEAAGWPFLRAPLAALAARSLGAPVEIGTPFRLRLLRGPALEAGTLRIGTDGTPPVPWLLDGRDVAVDLRWSDLWRWRRGAALRVARLEAGAVDLRLARDAEGRASWQFGGTPDERRAAPPPQVDRLRLRGGRIVVDDVPLAARLTVRIEGGEGDANSAAGASWRIAVDGSVRDLPVHVAGTTGGLLPLLDADAAEPLALRLEGTVGQARLRFDGRSAAWLASRSVEGTLALSAPSLQAIGTGFGLVLPRTAPVELTTRLVHDAGLWTLQAADARIGTSRLRGDLRVDTRATPLKLSGSLAGSRLALGELLPAIGGANPPAPRAAPAAASAPRADGPVRVLPQRRFDIPSLRAMDADVALALDTLDFGTPALAPVRALRTRIVLAGGVLALDGLQAQAAGGRVSGSSRLDGTQQPARWQATLRFGGVAVEDWVRGLRRTGGRPPWLTGTLDADLDVTGRGRSTAEILGSLDGRALLHVRDGTVSHLITEAAGLDLAQALGVWASGDRSLPLRCARFDLVLRGGVVTPRQAVFDNRDSTLRVGGTVNLADESLALVLRARPKDFSPLTLRSPVTVTGSLARPQVGIEGGPVAGRVLGAVVLGALVGPLAALLPLFDPGEGRVADPCAATPR
jgi:uncharacterized protein involved in outer membrane biogenesis